MKKCYIFLLLLVVTFSGYSQFQPAPSFFRTPRVTPLVELNTTQTILVSNYGATVNDGNDDLAGITAAINAAVSIATAQNPVRLLFDNGTYDLMPTSGTHTLSMTNANGVLWDGQGAEFLIHNPVVGFLSLLRCTNTIIKDLSVDYATLPFSQGIVTSIAADKSSFDFVLEDFSPLPTTIPFMDAPQRWGMFKNNKGGIKEGTRNLISHNQSFQSLGNRTYRYGGQNANTLINAEVGDYFVHIGRYNGSTLIINTQGKNVTYMNITGYAAPSGGFNSRDCEEWNVLDCHIKLKEGRVHSVNADAMHTNGNKIGPWVENCSFEGFSDDFMNIKYTRRTITEIHSATQITVLFGVDVGEVLEFYNPRDGVSLGSATVTNVQALGSNLFKLTLSNAVNVTTINAEDNQLADKAYIESRCNESFIFRNNIVRNSRRYGILIQSKYALIENNLFQNLSGSGIRIENGVDWNEGFRADQIEIRNNRFENCGYDKTYIDESNSAAISVDFAKVKTPCTPNGGFCGTESTTYRAHNNIRIIDNTILYNKKGLFLKNIEGLTVENNFICHRDQDITLNNGETPEEQVILNSTNVSVVDYNFVIPQPNIQFLLNEEPSAQDLENLGTNPNIGLDVITNAGGSIMQGFIDSEIGYAFDINTSNNGQLRLVNANDNSPFPGPIGGAARTYCFWVKPEQSIFQTFLYSGGPVQGEVFTVQMQSNGVVRVADNNQNLVRMDDMPLNIGQWNHIAVTVPENNSIFSVQLYKNGVASSETHSGSDDLINTASNRVDLFTVFDGKASDIRYFDYQLCGSEVESIFNDRQKTLSTNDLTENARTLRVYPTFVSNTLHFNKPVSDIQIVNILGKVLYAKSDSNMISELNVSHLPSGLYLLRIDKSQIFKIYKN